jgi:hypothetical protein
LTVDEVREVRGLPRRSVSDPQATS